MRSIKMLPVIALAIACTETPDEPANRLSSSRHQLSNSDSQAGYTHKLGASLFDVGPNAKEIVADTRVAVGDYGTFTTWPLGLVVALSNSDAPALSRSLLTTDPDVHNTRVRDYFVQNGLPEDQIASVNVHATMSGGGLGSEVDSSKAHLDWYTSVLARQVSGIPIFESVAWATLNEDGRVTKEAVFWPPVPTDAVQAALSLNAVVAKGDYFKQAPSVPSDGQVVVHHSIGMATTLTFVACYQVKPAPDMGDAPCYDSTGSKVDLSQLMGSGT